jgi:superfamily II DNA or RNA helicase
METQAPETHPDWPPGILFRPPRAIGWQTDFIVQLYLMRNALLAADTGLGKSMMTMGVAGLAAEQGVIDHVLVVCEVNKLLEWKDDFERHTRLPAVICHGPRARRLKILADLPTVIITTYETARDDAAVFPPKSSRSRTLKAGPLTEALEGGRVLVAYDEVTKLGRRSSNLYKAHNWMLKRLRAAQPGCRVLGLTATPMETDLDNIFNEMRLIVPDAMPTVAEYEERVIASRHPVYKTPRYSEEGKAWFRELCDPWILRKRKTDPNVRDSFPPLTEKFRRIRMHPDQFRAYQALEDLSWTPEGEHREVPGLSLLLRQLAGDPLAVLETARVGNSQLARMVAEEMGDELAKCSSAKAEELASIADLVMSSGQKLLVFTFFGQTVLPVLARRLEGRQVFTYHGGMSEAERERQKHAFKTCSGGAILLASDAAARGINLPEISYMVEYDIATKHSLREQRKGRGSRLGNLDPLTVISLILESSIEGASHIRRLIERNETQDYMLHDDEDEDHMSAADRRELFAQARPRKAG